MPLETKVVIIFGKDNNWKKLGWEFWGSGNIMLPEFSVGYTNVFNLENSLSYIIMAYIHFCLHVILQQKFTKWIIIIEEIKIFVNFGKKWWLKLSWGFSWILAGSVLRTE